VGDTREPGTIGDTFYGKEDHGILTVTVHIHFGPNSSSVQGFGGLGFKDRAQADDFIADLCTIFCVKALEDLKGKRIVLRCFRELNEPIEALQAPSGQVFALTTWRKKHYPEALDPLAAEKSRPTSSSRKLTITLFASSRSSVIRLWLGSAMSMASRSTRSSRWTYACASRSCRRIGRTRSCFRRRLNRER